MGSELINTFDVKTQPLWKVLTELKPIYWMKITYDSIRSNDLQTITVKPIKIKHRTRNSNVKTEFYTNIERDDGQKMRLTNDMGLFSMGSIHPYTGTALEIKLYNGNPNKQ